MTLRVVLVGVLVRDVGGVGGVGGGNVGQLPTAYMWRSLCVDLGGKMWLVLHLVVVVDYCGGSYGCYGDGYCGDVVDDQLVVVAVVEEGGKKSHPQRGGCGCPKDDREDLLHRPTPSWGRAFLERGGGAGC